jgi:hypothetical protein
MIVIDGVEEPLCFLLFVWIDPSGTAYVQQHGNCHEVEGDAHHDGNVLADGAAYAHGYLTIIINIFNGAVMNYPCTPLLLVMRKPHLFS